MEEENIKYKYNACLHYTVTYNICTICANNPSNIDNNPYLLGARNKCKRSNKVVCECIEFKNYNDLIKK